MLTSNHFSHTQDASRSACMCVALKLIVCEEAEADSLLDRRCMQLLSLLLGSLERIPLGLGIHLEGGPVRLCTFIFRHKTMQRLCAFLRQRQRLKILRKTKQERRFFTHLDGAQFILCSCSSETVFFARLLSILQTGTHISVCI